jgi:ligand-binding sensor domain-containing protein
MRFFLCIVCWLFFSTAVFSQEYGYTHYDSKEGLAGSTVYCMAQDKDGFIWFGTEGGASRFDGTHFKNFTKEDGLPDNEVLQLFADSKGRVWLAPFKKGVCYYYKGKMHTPANDPMLQRIRVNDFIIRFAEDQAGNILMQEVRRLHLVETNGRVTVIDSINSERIDHIGAISPRADGGFMVMERTRLFDYRNNRFQLRETLSSLHSHFIHYAMEPGLLVHTRDRYTAEVRSIKQHRSFTFHTKPNHIRYTIIDDSLVGHCFSDGAIIYNINGTDSPRYFLKDLPVNGIVKDAEGNTWFRTLGHGVYKLSSPHILNIKLRKNNIPAQVFAFAKYKENLLASTELNVLYNLNLVTGRLEKKMIRLADWGMHEVNFLHSHNGKEIICGSTSALFKLGPDGSAHMIIHPLGVKNVFPYANKLYVASTGAVFVVDPETFKITDTAWYERSAAVFVSNDTVYIGTTNGLYCRLPNRTFRFLGDRTPALAVRITAIEKDAAGVLWVGTYGDGLIGYKNGRVVATLTRRTGLTSNVCRAFYLQGNYLWVGTDKGINKINVAQPGYPVIKYTTGDGLVSDIINTLYVEGTNVFAGTPEGYTFFDEQKIVSQSRCDLLFTDVTVGGEPCNPDSIPPVIAHEKNSIRFNYAGISFRSNGDIRYRYRLLGLDSTWQETRETFLSYPTLPSGDYQLQLQAINKFDVSSRLLTAGFTIDKLLYEKTWFQLLIGVLFVAAIGLLIWAIIHRIRKRERQRSAINKRIGELEQLSRKAQMNPHFIFNSLNSIQQYVMDSDLAGANKFISGFSRLIRQTLDFSSKPEISLEEELDYLTNYLDLEKTRLENSFAWSVFVAEEVDPAEYYIPPMILQPFVENSVRHGLRFRRDKNGMVKITVKRAGDHLECILEDNGIGRKAAMQYKSISPINYQSKGLSLTADRISMFNKEHALKITMQIDDLEDDDHQALGTRVTINFPVQ